MSTDFQAGWEHYQDLLREAEKQRLLTEAGIHTGLQFETKLRHVAQNTVCRLSLFGQTRICTLSAPTA